MDIITKFLIKLETPIKKLVHIIAAYAVLIGVVFYCAGIGVIKLWLLPAVFCIITAYSVYGALYDKAEGETFGDAFARHLVDLVTRYIEVGY